MNKLSAFIITCDNRPTLKACVKRVLFSDEVVVVDKSFGREDTQEVAYTVKSFPSHVKLAHTSWTPVVEDTRRFAEDQCTGDWVLCLDDDEILSKNAGLVIRNVIENPIADVYRIPLHSYICGWYDPDGEIETKPSLYRKGKLIHSKQTQGFPEILGTEVGLSDIWIEHLSHPDIHSWIEKMNRYTSIPTRRKSSFGTDDIISMVQEVFSYYISNIKGGKDPRKEVIAVLRAMYASVDGLKDWWQDNQPDGHAIFSRICAEIEAE